MNILDKGALRLPGGACRVSYEVTDILLSHNIVHSGVL